MNRIFFYILLSVLAFSVTLVAVYFLNLSNLTQPPFAATDKVMEEITPEEKVEIVSETESLPEEVVNTEIIKDELTPKNYQDTNLINLEKELNSLDLSRENDIE